jgi:hypothetical protein
MTFFRAIFGPIVYFKFTTRFRILIRRILSMIIWPVRHGRFGHSLFFVLEDKETNKIFKDTMSLNRISYVASKHISPNAFFTESFFTESLFTENIFHRMLFSPNAFFTECIFHRIHISPNAFFTECFFHRMHFSPNHFSPNTFFTEYIFHRIIFH